MLINKRKNNNNYYHDLVEGRRKMFWKDVASKINLKFGTRYLGRTPNNTYIGHKKFSKIYYDQ